MELKNNLQQLSNKLSIKIEDKTVYSLYKYINNLHIQEYKAQDFTSMVEKINSSYISKSIKNEEYFIKNIAHTVNKTTKEPLFNFEHNNIDKNYYRTINKDVVKKLSYKTKNYNLVKNHFSKQNRPEKIKEYEKEIIDLSNGLYMYQHNNSTSFLDKANIKYGYKKLAKVKYLDYKNQDKTPVMLTFTLDKNYRKYAKYQKCKDATLGKYTGLREINKNVNLEDMIEKSYQKLNETFRDFYEYFKTKNKRSKDNDKLDFILVFEPHKSLTLHIHCIFYCNEVQLKNLEDTWLNYLKKLTPKQKKAQDYKVIDTSISNASTYLSKYLIKEYNTNADDISFYNKYRSYFSKFKFFRTSNFYHTTQKKINLMYQYFCKNYPDIIELIKKTTVPLYEVLEQFEIKELFIFEMEKIKSISFDRKTIQMFYDSYSISTIQDYQIKEEIVNNIDSFSNTITLSRVKSATFIYDHDLIVDILESYEIDTTSLSNTDGSIPPDMFYEIGMYEMREYSLSYSLVAGES